MQSLDQLIDWLCEYFGKLTHSINQSINQFIDWNHSLWTALLRVVFWRPGKIITILNLRAYLFLFLQNVSKCPESLQNFPERDKKFVHSSRFVTTGGQRQADSRPGRSLNSPPLNSGHVVRMQTHPFPIRQNLHKGILFWYIRSPKKQHEVARMAVAVDEICRRNGIRTVVDLGAGMVNTTLTIRVMLFWRKFAHVIAAHKKRLKAITADKGDSVKTNQKINATILSRAVYRNHAALYRLIDWLIDKSIDWLIDWLIDSVCLLSQGYLDCVLSEVLNYKVIAIESRDIRTAGAKDRVTRLSKKQQGKSNNLLHHATLCIDQSADSFEGLQKILASHGADTVPLCLVGLHCCGDFTPCFLRTFAVLPNAQAFVCVGCCYHLMGSVAKRRGNLLMPDQFRQQKKSKWKSGRRRSCF